MNITVIKDYLCLYNDKNNYIMKKNKKKLKKINGMNIKYSKYIDKCDILYIIKEYLKNIKEKNENVCGIIFLDKNIISTDINVIPKVPLLDYDILCLEWSIYKSYNTENINWCKVDLEKTNHFCVNFKSINKVINNINTLLIKKDHNIKTLFNNLITFALRKHMYSELEENYINIQSMINKQEDLFDEIVKKYDNLNIDSILYKTIYKESIKYMLPKVSLICPFTNNDKCFHTIMSFLYMQYPSELLELLIIVDEDNKNQLKLPVNDERIKILCTNKNVSLGHKLNVGVVNAKYDIIMHLFDISNYTLNLNNLITFFLFTKKECMLIDEISIYPNNYINISEIASLIYTKSFWEMYSFEETNCWINKKYYNIDILYKFIYNRIHEVILIFTSENINFRFNDNEYYKNKVLRHECTDCYEKYVDNKIKESFNMIIEKI